MLAVEVAQYIHALNIGTFDETGEDGDVFIAALPDSPDDCIAVYPKAGAKDDGTPTANPAIQIIVRCAKGNPTPGAIRAQDILDALRDFNSGYLVPDGTYIVHCKSMQAQPAYIKTDDNKRHEFSLNFQFLTTR